MNIGPVVFIAFLVGLTGVGLVFYEPRAGVTSQLDSRDAAKVAQGELLYSQACAGCHGANREGETPNWRQRRADGTLPAPPHDGTGHTWEHTDQRLFEITKFGQLKDICLPGPSTMPTFEKTLSDQEVWAVLSYIKSTWPADIQRKHDEVNRLSR